MTEPSLTAKAAVSLRILKQNLKEICYFHPVHGVPCSEWYAMKWCRKYPYFRTSISFFQNWLFIWGREVMKLKGNFNNVLFFVFFLEHNENTYWHINIHQKEKHTLKTALPCNARPFRDSSGSEPIFEEIQCLNSFRYCSTAGCEASVAGKTWDIKHMDHCSPSVLLEWQEGNILKSNKSVWANLGSMAKSHLTANLTRE